MSEAFTGEIMIFAGNFSIRSWAFCDGHLLNIAQNTELFSILGTIYGGDGRTTFGLPNLKGRLPMHAGRGPGLTPRIIGKVGGADTVTLTAQQLPSHSHTMSAVTAQGDLDKPASTTATAATGGSRGASIYGDAESLVAMAAQSLPPTGGGQAHSNDQPYQVVNFLVCLNGIYPSRG